MPVQWSGVKDGGFDHDATMPLQIELVQISSYLFLQKIENVRNVPAPTPLVHVFVLALWCVNSILTTFLPPIQVAEERVANMRTVRSFVGEDRECKVYNERVDEVLKLSQQEAVARGIFWATVCRLLFGFLVKT